MKKVTKQLLAGGAALILMTSTTIAQNDGLSYNRKSSKQATTISTETTETDYTAGRPKLADNFSKHFPGASNVTWSKMNTGSQASFVYAGKKSRAVFTEKDDLSYSVSEYSATELPANVAKLIKNDYSDYTVFNAQEVKANQLSCYHIVLESASGYVNLKISGDEIEEVSRTKKAK